MMSSSISTTSLNLPCGISKACTTLQDMNTHRSGFMIGHTPRNNAFTHSALSFVLSSSLTLPSPSTSEPACRPRMRSECQTLFSKSIRARRCARNVRT